MDDICSAPTNTWTCPCGQEMARYRGGGDQTCPSCRQWFNAFGQRLRQDWRQNPSNHDEDISDLEGLVRVQTDLQI